MFVVRPVKDKSAQKELCRLIGAEFKSEAMAYCAAELCENKADIAYYIGICQFKINEIGTIVSLTAADGCQNDEAIIVMCRAVMNLMYRSGCQTAVLPSTAGDAALLASVGMPKSENKDGYEIDLKAFYEAPCKYSKEKANYDKEEF